MQQLVQEQYFSLAISSAHQDCAYVIYSVENAQLLELVFEKESGAALKCHSSELTTVMT